MPMTAAKQLLHEVIERLTDEQAISVLAYAKSLLGESEVDIPSVDDLEAIKRGLADIRAGRVRSWEDLRDELLREE